MTDSTPQRNERLADALDNAGLTTADIAERLEVNIRSVQNWLASERTPRRDERMKLSLLLGVARSDLWPDVEDVHELAAVAEWPSLPTIPKEVWRDRFTDAQNHIDIAAGSAQFLAESIPDLHELLLAKADVLRQDVKIRVVFSDPGGGASARRDERETANPDNPLGPGQNLHVANLGLKLWSTILDGVANAELRVLDHDDIWTRSVFRFDDVLYQYDYVGDQRGFTRSVVEWRYVEPRGRFTDYLDHFEWCWEQATTPTEPKPDL